MIKKCRTLCLALAFFQSLSVPALAAGPTFNDVPETHWSYSYVEQAVQNGWVGGYGDGRFGPEDKVTYAQLSTMFVRAFYQDELTAYTGPTSPWYAAYCGVIDQQGGFEDTAVAGKAQDGAAVEQAMSRYELAHMVYNVLKSKGINISIDIPKTHAETADWDAIPIEHWAVVAVGKATGIMNGVDSNGTFAGDSLMTRAQACTILIGLDNYISEHASNEPVEPEQPVDGTRSPFELQDGETVRQMMARLNAEAPAYTAGYLTNGKPITEANIKEMLAEAQESMPEYTPWSADSRYNYSTMVFAAAGSYNEGGCNSFAAALSDYIFGKDAPSTMHQNFDQIKVGDVIWMKDSSTGYQHVALITDVQLADGFFSHGDGNVSSMVRWGRGEQLTRWTETKLAETYIFTRY